MEEIHQQRYCEHCKKNTVHVVREDAIEIEYICSECNQQQEIVKNFF
jgi:ribosomal protein L44E